MKWKKYTIETTSEAEELVAETLSECGITNVEIRDRKPILPGDTLEIYEEVMPKQLPDDGRAEVIFYMDGTEGSGPILSAVREGLDGLKAFLDAGPLTISEEETEDEDWVNNWKAFFHPFTVDDVLIKPTWEAMPENAEGKLLIEIDPGTAFGTGSHETTQLSIKALSKYMKPGDRVLDVGTGSGILSILAVKRGASFAFGTDIDPLAVEAAEENAQVNGVPGEKAAFLLGNIIDDPEVQEAAGFESYDVVVSNILADVIIPLQKEVVRHMKTGAYLLVSGIIDSKREALLEAFRKNEKLTLLGEDRLGEWMGFVLQKNGK